MLMPMMTTQMSAYDALNTGGPLATRATFGRPAGRSTRQMPGAKKKHHSVPKYLLNLFCDPKREVFAYNRIEKKGKCLPPTTVCVEKHLYTVIDRSGDRSDIVEEFFAEVDRQCASFIERVTSSHPTFHGSDRGIAVRFMASQFIRTPQIIRGIERAGRTIFRDEGPRLADEQLADMLNSGIWNADEIESIQHFKEHARELEVENAPADLPWHMDRIEQELMTRRLNFYIAVCSEGHVIISDYPIALIGSNESHATGGIIPGFSNATEIWCPLSPELALVATQAALGAGTALYPKLSIIHDRNKRIALDSHRWTIERPGAHQIRHLNIPKTDGRYIGSDNSLWSERSKVPGERPIGVVDLRG